jgi:hypothetical protein
MVDTTLEIYKQNVPFGLPTIKKDLWDSSDQPEIKVEPESGYILFVKGVSFIMTDTCEFSGTSAYMRIKHSTANGTNIYLQIDIADTNELLAMCEQVSAFEKPTSTPYLAGHINFFPPVRCRSSQSEYFTVIEEGTLAVAGEITIIVHAWQMLESEFD